jgi:hypothetical protein
MFSFENPMPLGVIDIWMVKTIDVMKKTLCANVYETRSSIKLGRDSTEKKDAKSNQ